VKKQDKKDYIHTYTHKLLRTHIHISFFNPSYVPIILSIIKFRKTNRRDLSCTSLIKILFNEKMWLSFFSFTRNDFVEAACIVHVLKFDIKKMKQRIYIHLYVVSVVYNTLSSLTIFKSGVRWKVNKDINYLLTRVSQIEISWIVPNQLRSTPFQLNTTCSILDVEGMTCSLTMYNFSVLDTNTIPSINATKRTFTSISDRTFDKE